MLLVVRPPYPFFPTAPGLLVFSVCLDGSIQYAFFSVPFYRLLGGGFPPLRPVLLHLLSSSYSSSPYIPAPPAQAVNVVTTLSRMRQCWRDYMTIAFGHFYVRMYAVY